MEEAEVKGTQQAASTRTVMLRIWRRLVVVVVVVVVVVDGDVGRLRSIFVVFVAGVLVVAVS